MSKIHRLKRGNTSPSLLFTCKDASNNPVDLTGGSLVMKWRNRHTGVTKVNAAADIVTATAGVGRYTVTTGDTDVEGWYDIEVVFTAADNSVETFPNVGFEVVHVHGSI